MIAKDERTGTIYYISFHPGIKKHLSRAKNADQVGAEFFNWIVSKLLVRRQTELSAAFIILERH